MTTKLDQRQRIAVNRIAALVLVNAMMFQEVLSQKDERVRPLQDFEHHDDPLQEFSSHWKFILDEINYYPIFNLAHELLICISADRDAIGAVQHLAQTARRIVSWRASLRHDLAGRIFHRLLLEAKYLGAYYTSIPASVLLAKLALYPDDWAIDWADLNQVRTLRVADLACGTGTLLMAAADVVADNYIRACANKSEPPKLSDLHQSVVEEMIWGLDVLASAVHLTASTLSLRVPDIPINVTNLTSLDLGAEGDHLGSLEFLEGPAVSAPSLFGELPQRVHGRRAPLRQALSLPQFDLCIMNPPFTSSRQPNLLFGSLPARDRARMQKKLKKLVKDNKVPASITAGLAAVFVALGDKYLKPGGRLALVLPRALLSGVAWAKSRELLAQSYLIDYLIVSHEPDHWNFSENTDLSEVLVVATKKQSIDANPKQHEVTCVNLWHNPRNAIEALALSRLIAHSTPPLVPSKKTTQGALQLKMDGLKFGEALAVPWQTLKQTPWGFPCAFAQSDLIRLHYTLLESSLLLPGQEKGVRIPLCSLGDLASLGPDPRDIYDAFDIASGNTAYPAIWGAKNMNTMGQSPNCFLEPLAIARPRRNLRKVADLWPKAGRVLITQRPRLNTKTLAAMRVDRRVLAQVWWPVIVSGQLQNVTAAEKALTIWLNSTLGLIFLISNREETQGPWVQFKKPVLESMPTLDLRGLSKLQLSALASAYDDLHSSALRPFPEMHRDPIREKIDGAVSRVLGLPKLDILRELLSHEPIISLSLRHLVQDDNSAYTEAGAS